MQNPLPYLEWPVVADDDPRDRGAIRQGNADRPGGQFVRGRTRELAVEREDRLGLLERMDHDTSQHRADGMELVLEGSDHAKVPAATPHAPEEVGVLCGAGREELAVGRDEIDREQVIGSQAVLACQVAPATAKGESGDAGRGDLAPGRGQAKGLRLVVELAPGEARLSTGCAAHGIDAHTLHAREVKHHAAVAHRVARDVMAAPAHRHQELVRAGEIDALDHVGNAGTAGDEGWAPVDHAIPDGAGRVVTGIASAQQWTAQAGPAMLRQRLPQALFPRLCS